MAIRNQADPRQNFVPKFLPWLLAAAVFGLYALTLNHWVSLLNCLAVAKISGWTWQPEIYNPLFFIVTVPLRWLPVNLVPVALNLFAAVCATATLGLLARSVAILPRDRTDLQRKCESSVFSFLTTGSAWLPPVFAVLVCGLQMTFWEQATNCTTEMFDLLLFAFVIWSLLEFRLDERVGRLYLAAVVYGAGISENWAMLGFLPVFIGAIIWIRGLDFFNLGFLQRMLLCGLAGMLCYLVLPLLAVASHHGQITFWEAMKLNLMAQWMVVKMFFTVPPLRHTVLLLAPASLLPVFVMAIRWRSSSGDNSKLGLALTTFMFHLIHGVFLVVCVWVAFDPPLSARHLGFGQTFLTFYYLGALSVGYYSGYFLLLFGKRANGGAQRSKSRSKERRSARLRLLNSLIAGSVWCFAAFAVTGMLYRNVPQIRDANDDSLKKYFALAAENLPRGGGILLSDDSRRLIFAQAALAQQKRLKDFVPLDTQLLPAPPYHSFLHEKYPQRWPDTVSAAEKTNGVGSLHLIGLLTTLAKTNDLYYLHPSFGYYFEQFYAEPHGLVYQLKLLPNETLLPPPLPREQMAENEAFWAQTEKTAFAPIIAAVTPPDPIASRSVGGWLLKRFHVPREPGVNAALAGAYYSRSLNFWGVQTQRAGDLTNAAPHFEMAHKLNPDNTVAQINLQFNQDLRDGKGTSEDLADTLEDPFGKYRTMPAALSANGPFDVPSFCFEIGVVLASQNPFPRQAVEPFERVRQLVPNNLASRLWLAQIYVSSRLPDRALDALHKPLTEPATFLLNATNSSQLDLLAAAAYFQKTNFARGSELLELEMSRHPTNDDLLVAASQAYVSHALYPKALAVIDRKLQLSPDDPTWLFGRGYVCIQMKNYDDAIAAFTRLLTIQTNNPDALFNRAIARLNSGKLDDARADYEKLWETATNSFQVAYGLGEIAWRKHETNEAVKYFTLYLATANTNSAEARDVIQRLQEIQGQPH